MHGKVLGACDQKAAALQGGQHSSIAPPGRRGQAQGGVLARAVAILVLVTDGVRLVAAAAAAPHVAVLAAAALALALAGRPAAVVGGAAIPVACGAARACAVLRAAPQRTHHGELQFRIQHAQQIRHLWLHKASYPPGTSFSQLPRLLCG